MNWPGLVPAADAAAEAASAAFFAAVAAAEAALWQPPPPPPVLAEAVTRSLLGVTKCLLDARPAWQFKLSFTLLDSSSVENN